MSWLLCKKPVAVSGSRIALHAGFEKDRLAIVNNILFPPRYRSCCLMTFRLKLDKKGQPQNFHLPTRNLPLDESNYRTVETKRRENWGSSAGWGSSELHGVAFWTSHGLARQGPKEPWIWKSICFGGFERRVGMERGMTHVMLFFGRGAMYGKPGGPLRITTQCLGAEGGWWDVEVGLESLWLKDVKDDLRTEYQNPQSFFWNFLDLVSKVKSATKKLDLRKPVSFCGSLK